MDKNQRHTIIVEDENGMSEKKGGIDITCCLPYDRKMRKQNIDQEILVVRIS